MNLPLAVQCVCVYVCVVCVRARAWTVELCLRGLVPTAILCGAMLCDALGSQIAFDIMVALPDADSTDAQAKWKQLSDLALATSNLVLAQDCSLRAGDLGGLLLLHTSCGNRCVHARCFD